VPVILLAQPDKSSMHSLLWQVSGKGLKKPSYLFGTFHLLCKDQVVFSNELKQKLANADEVYFEVDLSNPKTMIQSLTSMNMKEDKKLRDLMSEKDYNKLDSILKAETKLSLSFFSRMKPYLVSTLFYSKFMKCAQQSGIDMELMQLAKKSNKKINGLETLEYQASIFDSIPYEDQARELLKMADSLPHMEAQFNDMLKVYLSQDLNKISELSNETDLAGVRYKSLMLTNRNKNWVEQLKTLMPGKSLFVAVGAGHLGGEDGVIDLLRKEGYKLKPLKNMVNAK
jgi:uncharacterized protein YbaP (TraB family)